MFLVSCSSISSSFELGKATSSPQLLLLEPKSELELLVYFNCWICKLWLSVVVEKSGFLRGTVFWSLCCELLSSVVDSLPELAPEEEEDVDPVSVKFSKRLCWIQKNLKKTYWNKTRFYKKLVSIFLYDLPHAQNYSVFQYPVL